MASDPSVGACNDVNPLLAIIDHGSDAGLSTCNNGDDAPAVVGSPGLETNSIAQSNVCTPLNDNHCQDTYHWNGLDQRRIPFQTPSY